MFLTCHQDSESCGSFNIIAVFFLMITFELKDIQADCWKILFLRLLLITVILRMPQSTLAVTEFRICGLYI